MFKRNNLKESKIANRDGEIEPKVLSHAHQHIEDRRKGDLLQKQ